MILYFVISALAMQLNIEALLFCYFEKKVVAVRFLCPPFEEEGVYCFANVGRSVGLSVGQ